MDDRNLFYETHWVVIVRLHQSETDMFLLSSLYNELKDVSSYIDNKFGSYKVLNKINIIKKILY